jgi:hypothetical protein
VCGVFVFPIILSLSKGRLSPNGEGYVFGVFVFPIILSMSKDRLSPNGVWWSREVTRPWDRHQARFKLCLDKGKSRMR